MSNRNYEAVEKRHGICSKKAMVKYSQAPACLPKEVNVMKDRQPMHIGTNRQLFVDDLLLAEANGVKRKLHSPIPQEVVLPMEQPWEGKTSWASVIIKDGEKFSIWYRVAPHEDVKPRWSGTAYADSKDGIHWTRPKLGLFDFRGSKANNLVWMGPGSNMSVFKDEKPGVPSEQRYKAITRSGGAYGLVSKDGVHWRLIQEEPILTGGAFDSHNIVFQDPWTHKYVYYGRGVLDTGEGRIRRIRHATSDDFINWTPLEYINMGDEPMDQLYTNAATPYWRAKGIYLMFPKRFIPERTFHQDWAHKGQSDIVFASSRDGIHWDRTFLEAFVRPGLDPKNWHERAIMMGPGIVQTGSHELSMYYFENYRTDNCRIRRCTLRLDGFVSVNAGYDGGEFTTRPLVFAGSELELNYSTSAVGFVRVEIQHVDGRPIESYTLDDCPEIYGDEIEGIARWKHGSNVSKLAGKPIRLRFAMKDGDLFAFRFRPV